MPPSDDPRARAGVLGALPSSGKRRGGVLARPSVFVYKNIRRAVLTHLPPQITAEQLRSALEQVVGTPRACEVRQTTAMVICETPSECEQLCTHPERLSTALENSMMLTGGTAGGMAHAHAHAREPVLRAERDENGTKFETLSKITVQELPLRPIEFAHLDQERAAQWKAEFLPPMSHYVFFPFSIRPFTVRTVREKLAAFGAQYERMLADGSGFYLLCASAGSARECYSRLREQSLLGEPLALELILNGAHVNAEEEDREARKRVLMAALSDLQGELWAETVRPMVHSVLDKMVSERVGSSTAGAERRVNNKRSSDADSNTTINSTINSTVSSAVSSAGSSAPTSAFSDPNSSAHSIQTPNSSINFGTPSVPDMRSIRIRKVHLPNKAQKPNPRLTFHALPITPPGNRSLADVLSSTTGGSDEQAFEKVLREMLPAALNQLAVNEQQRTQWPPTSVTKPYLLTPYTDLPFSSEWKPYISSQRTKQMYEVVENYEGLPIAQKKSQRPVQYKRSIARTLGLPLRSRFIHFNEFGHNVDLKELVKPARIARSRIHDWGLYASEPIKENEFVVEYVGEVIGDDMADIRERMYLLQGMNSTYMFRMEDGGDVVDATLKGNLSRFINHSCDPNCRSQLYRVNKTTRIVFFSARPIAVDEELTINYNLTQAENGEERIKCRCGSAKCSGWLT